MATNRVPDPLDQLTLENIEHSDMSMLRSAFQVLATMDDSEVIALLAAYDLQIFWPWVAKRNPALMWDNRPVGRVRIAMLRRLTAIALLKDDPMKVARSYDTQVNSTRIQEYVHAALTRNLGVIQA